AHPEQLTPITRPVARNEVHVAGLREKPFLASNREQRHRRLSAVHRYTRSTPGIGEPQAVGRPPRPSQAPRRGGQEQMVASARVAEYTSLLPSSGASASCSSPPPDVTGVPSPSRRPARGSKGNAHNRVVDRCVLKTSRAPSGDTATSPSCPAPVVNRSGPPVH